MAMNAGDGDAGANKRSRAPFNLGEVIGLTGVVIAGLGLFFSYVSHERDRQAADQAERLRAQVQSVLVLRGEGEGSRIRLAPANPDQIIQNQTFYFPSAIRGDAVRITGSGHLDADWFAAGLKRALHGAYDNGAEHEMPVVALTNFLEDGEVRTDQALYQIGFTIHLRLLQSAEVRMEGVALSRRGLAGPQAAVNTAWAAQAPARR